MYLILGINWLTWILCIAFYPEKYLFWRYYVSDLSRIISIHGFDNAISSRIFFALFIINAFISIIFAVLIQKEPISGNGDQKLKYVKSFLCCVLAVGFCLVAFPYDYGSGAMHMYGAIILFISTTILANTLILEMKVKKFATIFSMCILNILIFGYAIMTVMHLESAYVQKILFIIVTIVCIMLPFFDGDKDLYDFPLALAMDQKSCNDIGGKWVNNKCLVKRKKLL